MNLDYLSENIVYNDFLKIDQHLLDAYQLYRDLKLEQPLFIELIKKSKPEKNNFVFIDIYSKEKSDSFPGDVGEIPFLKNSSHINATLILIGAYYYQEKLCYLYFDLNSDMFYLINETDNKDFINTFLINTNHNIKEFLYKKFINKLKLHFSGVLTDLDDHHHENFQILDYSYYCYQDKNKQI